MTKCAVRLEDGSPDVGTRLRFRSSVERRDSDDSTHVVQIKGDSGPHEAT